MAQNIKKTRGGLIYWECLNVGTIPTYKMRNIGTVPTFKMHNVGTVPMFKMQNVGTQKKMILVLCSNFDCIAKINDCSLCQLFYLSHLEPIFKAFLQLFNHISNV